MFMKKIYALTLFTCLISAFTIAQNKAEVLDLNCYNKWSVKFEERGAEDVKDGVYTDVIVSFRQGSKANCYTGKAEVIDGKIAHFYTENVDGQFTQINKQWKPSSPKEVTIINGISITMITIHNELINVIWPNKIKPKKAALKRAPDPDDD